MAIDIAVLFFYHYQCSLASELFASAMPAGWTKAFSMSMSYNGKNEYSLKDGTIVLYVPDEFQKSGREFKIMAMDSNGKVKVLTDSDHIVETVTVSPQVAGYAYWVIYKD